MKIQAITIAVLAALSAPISAQDNDDNWIFRASVAQISPNDDSGTVLGGGVGVDDATGIGLSVTYMMDDQWGIEILGALPFNHDIVGTGELSGVNIGETDHLPPTFSIVYQWGSETKYHVGAGLNYTVFFDEEAAQDLNNALDAEAELDLESSLGAAIKFGFDTPINNDWSFSGNIYYMNIDTTADVIVNDSVAASVDVDIDPWVLMLGVSTTF